MDWGSDARARSGPRPTEPAILDGLTDTAHAERFADAYGARLRFVHPKTEWRIFNAPLWRRDIDGEVWRVAMDFARVRQHDALGLSDRTRRERAVAFGIRCESKSALEKTLSLARALHPIADDGADWDRDPFLVGAPNVLIDLRTGDSRPGTPDDRVTMAVGATFDPEADAPRWRQFLAEIFDGDALLIAFIQRYLGYCLTGETTEQVLALCFGRGANGKTTVLNLLSHVFGDYAANTAFSTLELRGRSTIPSDVAALVGKRLVTASETNDGTRLNEARLKALTGGDVITARELYQSQFSFKPVAKFLLAVNHKPTVHDDSFGFWRRILLVPFMRCFTASARDTHLEDTLKGEASGILNWAIAGCLAWQHDGLQPPDCVRQATEEYRQDADPLNDFLAEACDIEANQTVKASAVQAAYQKWADKQGLSKHDRLSAKTLGQRLADRFQRRHTREGWVYDGIRIATERLF
jgi:putative DNA primase/helicase